MRANTLGIAVCLFTFFLQERVEGGPTGKIVSRLKIRTIIWYHWRQGHNGAKTVETINNTFGDKTVSNTTVCDWFRRFRERDESIEDKERSGRPVEVDDPQLVELLENQPSLSAFDIAEQLNFDPTTICRHIHKLGYKLKLEK